MYILKYSHDKRFNYTQNFIYFIFKILDKDIELNERL